MDGKKARLRIFVDPKKPSQRRVDDVDNAPHPINHKSRKIGMKINRYAIGKNSSAVEWYVNKLAYFAVRAVGADQILAGETTLLTALNIFGEGDDALLLLLDIDDLKPVRDLRASSFGALPQYGLETRLSDEQAP